MVTQRTTSTPNNPSHAGPIEATGPQESAPLNPQAQPLYPSNLRSVDALLGKPLHELEALYAAAICPEISALDGEGQGRMLAVTGWGSKFPLGRWLPKLAGGHYFPWKGKNFAPCTDASGEGINRTLSHRWPLRLFRFETEIAHSLYDGAPAYVLDYDLSSNPGFIRRIRDEIRQISPDVFLGQAWIRMNDYHFALYFGIQFP